MRPHPLLATILLALLASLTIATHQLEAGVIITGSTYDDYDAAFADVPALDAVGKLTYNGGLATGNYLGEGWVLTAAHVADSASSFTFTIDGLAYQSQAVFVHPDWTGDIAAGGDIALIQLTTDNVAAPLVPLYTDTTASLVDQTVVLSGFGKTGTGDTGATGSAGTLHSGHNLIESYGGANFFFRSYDPAIVFFDFDNPNSPNDGYNWSSNSALPFEYMIAQGDSGGGAFVQSDGQYHIVAVNSFILATDGTVDADYGDIGGLTAVPGYLDWIATTIGFDSTLAYDTGDLDRNGEVTFLEAATVVANIGLTPAEWFHGDANGNDIVELTEAEAAVANLPPQLAAEFPQFTTQPLPEPAIATILALLLIATVPRRPPASR